MKKTKTKNQKGASMVVHIPESLHSRLKLHTVLKDNSKKEKITLAKEAIEAIENHISREGYV